jgi:predicted outer membrane repeat protein
MLRTALRLAAAAAVLQAAVAPAQTIIYVDEDAPPGGDGQSWPTAFADLTEALAAAAAGDEPAEVRIAGGTYHPDQGTGDRARSFEVRAPNIASGLTVWLRGGFAGLKGNDPNKVDFVKYQTILSGDLNGDDEPGFVNRADNSERVLDVDIDVSVDGQFGMTGLTVRGGSGDPQGGAGGGVRVRIARDDYHSSPSEVRFCRFTDNSAGAGGGLAVLEGRVEFDECEFLNNRAVTGGGGALHVDVFSEVRIEDSTLTGNAAVWGGALYSRHSTSTSVIRSDLAKNTAEVGGGAAYLKGWGTFNRSEITDNCAHSGDGGAVWASSGAGFGLVTMTGNSADQGRGGAVYALDYLGVSASVVAANSAAGDGGALYSAGYLITDSTLFTANQAGGDGGAIACTGASAQVINATMTANSAARSALAMLGVPDAEVTATLIWGNGFPDGPEVLVFGPGAMVRFDRCDIQGGEAGIDVIDADIDWPPTNTDADPLFADPDGPDNNPSTWADNNFRLSPGSPCIEGGLSGWDQQYDEDADGLPRLVNADCDCTFTADIGAFEFQGSNCPPQAPRLYVNAAAAPGGDGLSWDTAFADLQDALRTPSVSEVWVAAGVYRPDGGTGDRAATFHMSCDAAIYGGFAGVETDLSQRDPVANPTVLSGDLAGDDGPDFANNGENSHRVADTGYSTLILDGFTITGGNARHSDDDWAAGLLCLYGNLTLSNCRIVNNTANDAAGLGSGGTTVLTSCVIAGNAATGNSTGVGGASLWGNEATSVDCEFSGNSSTATGYARAGGLRVDAKQTVIDRCRFIGNSSSAPDAHYGHGGGLQVDNGVQDCSITNCLFVANRVSCADYARGGAIFFAGTWLPSHRLVNCTIVGNRVDSAYSAGGGVFVPFFGAELLNCIVWGNSAGGLLGEFAQIDAGYDAVTIGYSIVQNWTGNFGGAGNSGKDPLPIDPVGPDGVPGSGDEDWHLSPSSPAIDAADNSAIPEGVVSDLDGSARFVDDPATQDTGVGPSPIADIGAYEFAPPWCADCDGSGVLDLFDFLCFVNLFNAAEPASDCTADGVLDLFDFLCFTNAFNAGC